MSSNKPINGEGGLPPMPERVVDVGAVVELDEEVMKHGVLFVHPRMQPFKLFFKFEDGQLKTHFEPLASIDVPNKALILPGGEG